MVRSKTASAPCGSCGATIRFKFDRFARRRVRGRYRIVCAKCAAEIDAQTTLDRGGAL
jgi:hypothetical protein